MTPHREAYLAKCSEREKWLRKNIRHWQRLIQNNKWALNNDKQITEDDKLYYLSNIRKYKYKIFANRHELARMKGMDRVVVPMEQYNRSLETDDWYCSKCEEGISVFENYCPKCGRRILWKKVGV